MGKKKPAEMAAQRLVFVEGAMARDVGEDLANAIFDQMETFAGYGFNKSHSAAYALLAYQTAWLKTHHTAAFMAAVLSADLDNTDKLDEFIHECRELGIAVEPPDINRSQRVFWARDERHIVYGLGGIKGLGHGAIDALTAEREAHGPYTDLASFCGRLDLQKFNRRVIEVMIRSGALDALDPARNRARMVHELPEALQAAEQSQRDRASGQADMFGALAEPASARPVEHAELAPWTTLQLLKAEHDALGLYLTGHPTEVHAADLARFTSCTLGAIDKRIPPDAVSNRRAGVPMTLAGSIRAVRRRVNRGGYITIEDHTGRLEVALYDQTWAQYADLLTKDEIIVVEGKVAPDEFSGGHRMTADRILTLSQARAAFARGVHLSLRGPCEDVATQLQDVFRPYRSGRGQPVFIDYSNGRARAQLELGEEWRIDVCEELIVALSDLPAVNEARLVY
jgi:DNA polymerase-3 subunit alpha